MKRILTVLSLSLCLFASAQAPITDTATLRTTINSQIVPNGTKQITAAMLNRILNGYLNSWPFVNNSLIGQINTPLYRVPFGTGSGLQNSDSLRFTGVQLNLTGEALIHSVGTNTGTHWIRQDRFVSNVFNTASGLGSELYYTPAFSRISYGTDFGDISGLHTFNRISMDNTGIDIRSNSAQGGRVTIGGGTASGTFRDSIVLFGSSLRLKNIPYSTLSRLRVLLRDTVGGIGTVYNISFTDLATILGVSGGGGGGGASDTLQNQGTGDTVLTKVSTHLYGIKSFTFGNGNGVGFDKSITATDMVYTPKLLDLTGNTILNGNAHSYSMTNTTDYSIGATGTLDMGGAASLIRGAVNFPSYVTPSALTGNVNDFSIAVSGFAQTVVRLSSTVDVNISGIDIQNTTVTQMGRMVFLHNLGSFAIRLLNQSTLSLAANRFALPGNYVINPGESVQLSYDAVSNRWRIVGLQSAVATSGGGTRFSGSSVSTVDIDLTSYSAAHTIRIEFHSLVPVNDNVDVGIRLSPDFSTWNTTLYGWQFTDRDGDHDFGTLAVPDDHITAAKALENTASSVRGTIKISNPGTTTVQPVISYEFSYIDTFGKLNTVKGSGGRFNNQAIGGVRLYITTGSNIASYDYTIYSE